MAKPMNEVDAPVEISKVPDPDQDKQTEEMETVMEFDEDYTYFDDDDDDCFVNDDDDDVYDEDDQTYDHANYLAAQLDADRLPPGAEVSFPWLQSTSTSAPDASGSVASQPAILKPESDVEKKHRLFKQFDVVSDHSGHHFSAQRSKSGILGRKESVEWSRKIQNDWKLLENDLPESIFVRVYEERIDLMRAVIVGAHGTPYHDGLFFFDILFPSDYPANPPRVHYHSGGLRLNPNLYECGKVCLSLLNTWEGKKDEKWNPKISNMLQVLLSIQALVLNEKPYFNEPGYAKTAGQVGGERKSILYSENTFILSCRTMMYTLKRPPMHFEDLVRGHFCLRADAILSACKAYMSGAQVGYLSSGSKMDDSKAVDSKKDDSKISNKSQQSSFVSSLEQIFPTLVIAFNDCGADCQKFLPKPVRDINSLKVYDAGTSKSIKV